ncbi:MAG: protein kinase [Deltaproteobacteria bacterium]|nr:protein kinase [Deltaproteobacteria bacterium]
MYCPVCHSEYPADWKACPKDATGLLKSAQIGKYRIEGMLGIGGMGAVYKATNPDIKGSRVAIKVMNPAIAGAEQVRERFKREAAAVAALRTSHVVKVFDFNAEPDGMLYLVMELMDGHALREEILPAPDYMDLARVQMVMDGALKGLAAAHKVGIVHRDLKPENIFVAETDDGEVPKLLDFGIARVRTQDKNLTHTGSLMGTASYMAQEQIGVGATEIGSWSDVYAMGAILYEMLAGAPAFGGNTVTEVLQRVLKAECVPLASVRPGLSAEVYALVDRCMSNTPAVRPQDAEAMRIALNAARLVDKSAPVPPPHKTRVDSIPHVPAMGPAPGSAPGNKSSGGTALGVMATEAPRDTPTPRLTPPPGTPPAGVSLVSGTGPGITPGVSAFGPTVGMGGIGTGTSPGGASASSSASDVPVKKSSKLPLVLGGVAVVGIGGFLIARSMGGEKPETQPVKADAGVVAIADAVAATPDTQVAVVTPDAAPAEPLPEFTKDMIKVAAGDYDIGEDTPTSDVALKKTKATIGEFWLDKDEVTLEAVRKALTSPKLGGLRTDLPTTPARNVTWGQAVATCKALGKRLPNEAEWEIAARATPKDPAKAALMKPGSKPVLAPTKHEDCSGDGLCDMLGGVIEWTADGTPKGKIVRGASFTVSPAAGWQASIHFRTEVPPTADDEVGFRCAWSKELKGAKTGDATPVDRDAIAQPQTTVLASTTLAKPSPPASCDDVEGQYQEARRLAVNASYAAAIAKAEAAVRCKPENRGYVTIAIAACGMKNAAKANAAVAKISGPGQKHFVGQTCEQSGIRIDGFDPDAQRKLPKAKR